MKAKAGAEEDYCRCPQITTVVWRKKKKKSFCVLCFVSFVRPRHVTVVSTADSPIESPPVSQTA